MAIEVTADLIADMQAILQHPIEEVNKSSDLKNQFGDVYKKWTGQKVCCPEVIPQEYLMMATVVRHFLNNKIKMSKPKSNYVMVDNMIIYYPEKHMQVGNINLTDELAAEMLADHPEWAKHFPVIPEGKAPEQIATPEEDAKHENTLTENKKAFAESEADRLSKMTRAELTAFAKEKKFPEEEYKKLNAKNLLNYISGKAEVIL